MKRIIISESQLKNILSVVIKEDTVKLRKLTGKSKWEFSSKYSGWDIQKVLDNDIDAVYWVYTHFEKISFVDDILDVLEREIPTFKRIEKPGVDKEQYEAYKNKKNPWMKYTYKELKNIIKAKKINKEKISPGLLYVYKMKKEKAEAEIDPDKLLTKGKLQAFNHGKINGLGFNPEK